VDQKAEVDQYQSVTDLPPPEFAPGANLSLQDAVRLCNAYNERLAIQGEQYLRSLIARRRAVADLIPTLDVFGDLTLREHTSTGRTSSFDAGFEGQYTLFTGLSDLRDVDAAEADARAQRWLLLDLREVLMLETVRSYYNVLQAERLVAVLESSSAAQEERLRDIRGRRAVGFARPLDVAQIESQSADTKVTLLDAKNAVARARSALTLLTGVEVHASRLTDSFDPPASSPALEYLLASAYQARQDLIAGKARADAERSRVDAALGEYAPSIGINIDWFLNRDTSPSDLDLSSLISINLPLFSAGRIESDIRESWSFFRQRVMEYQSIRRQIRRDVEAALADLDSSRERIRELAVQVAAADEALRQAEASYAAGLGTNLERVLAQDQLLSAQLRQATEQYTLKIASLALERACGRLSSSLAGAPEQPPTPEELVPPTSPFVRRAPASTNDGTPAPAPGGAPDPATGGTTVGDGTSSARPAGTPPMMPQGPPAGPGLENTAPNPGSGGGAKTGRTTGSGSVSTVWHRAPGTPGIAGAGIGMVVEIDGARG
jgi:outer membrane protein TolC